MRNMDEVFNWSKDIFKPVLVYATRVFIKMEKAFYLKVADLG